jgi:phosphate-selective porin OprO and OprP
MRRVAWIAFLLAFTGASSAGETWLPPKIVFGSGTQVSLTGNVAYDVNRFGGEFDHPGAEGVRRKEFGIAAKRKDYFDAGAQYEFESRTWMDVYVRAHSKGLLGTDIGSVRVGWIKTPVGLEGLTASRAPSFLEAPLPSQAIYAGRRTGVEYSLGRPNYQFAVAYYGGNDPEGLDQGRMWGGRSVWSPRTGPGDIWHFGASHSSERPAGGRARLRARPEAGLTDVRLVDTGALTGVQEVERSGLELIRVAGPLAVQAEYLAAQVDRAAPGGKVNANGASGWVSWVVTGESRPYSGTLGNIVPTGRYGALELLARYSTLDLDSTVHGGVQRSLTLGANYYWTQHVKVQVNYLRSHAQRNGADTRLNGFVARVQTHF